MTIEQEKQQNINEPERHKDGEVTRKILFALKKNIILILIIFALSITGGYIYYKNQKPIYTSSEMVIYFATVPESVSSEESYYNTSLTSKYMSTVTAFFRTPVVINRANYYYKFYLNNISKYANFDYFYNKLILNGADDTDLKQYILDYDETVLYNSGINKVNMNVNTNNTNGANEFVIYVGYTDGNSSASVSKARVLIAACSHEVNLADDNDPTQSRYFGVTVHLEDQGLISLSNNINKSRIILYSAMIGFGLSLILVFVLQLFNKSIKDKDELESITDSNVLSYINKRTGV